MAELYQNLYICNKWPDKAIKLFNREEDRRQRCLNADGLCASSCANSIFVAAKSKSVPPYSLLAFHGGASYGTDRTQVFDAKVFNFFTRDSRVKVVGHDPVSK